MDNSCTELWRELCRAIRDAASSRRSRTTHLLNESECKQGITIRPTASRVEIRCSCEYLPMYAKKRTLCAKFQRGGSPVGMWTHSTGRTRVAAVLLGSKPGAGMTASVSAGDFNILIPDCSSMLFSTLCASHAMAVLVPGLRLVTVVKYCPGARSFELCSFSAKMLKRPLRK